MEYNPGDPGESFDRVCESFGPPKEVRAYSREVVLGVWEKKADLDRLIRRSSKNWRVERMTRVDLNILRIAIYEVVYRKDVPPKVSIDEAVELGKRYGTEESGAFINGILDHIYNELKAEEVDQQGG
jgi:transcription antitermination factor NusB